MNSEAEILAELREISPLLAQISRKDVFTVPENYFEGLEEKICLCATQTQAVPTCAVEQIISPLTIPDGYFDNLSDNILARIKHLGNDELSHEFPVLNALKRKQVLSVPEGYFNNLSGNILSAIHRQPQARVIAFTKRAWWKYAAAAIFTGLLLISALFIFSPGNKDFPKYLAAANKYQSLTQITKGIEALPEEDIVQYLELYSRTMDNELIMKNVDPKDLPSEWDYLVDENTLSTYLNKIDFQNP